jgi:hypothetical protein
MVCEARKISLDAQARPVSGKTDRVAMLAFLSNQDLTLGNDDFFDQSWSGYSLCAELRDRSLLGITGVEIFVITRILVHFHKCFMASKCVHNSTDFSRFSR